MKSNLVDRDDPPPLTGEELKRPGGKWRIGGKEVTAEEGQAAFRARLRGKVRINIHLDKDVVAYFKGEAGPRGYQTLINSALRRIMEGADLKDDLLEVIDKRMAQLALPPASMNTSIGSTVASGRLQFFGVNSNESGVSATNANSVAQVSKSFGMHTLGEGHA
jgi:hypothetical protein